MQVVWKFERNPTVTERGGWWWWLVWNRWLFGLLVATAAEAETIRGTFTYLDFNPDAGRSETRPVAEVKVELWRNAPRNGGAREWRLETSGYTDAQGFISFNLPFITAGAECTVKLLAENDAATVWPMEGAGPYAVNAGTEDGIGWIKTVQNADTILDFSYTFRRIATMYFNLAETVRVGRRYAESRRGAGAQDIIGRVNVWPTPSTIYGKSFFQHTNDTLVILTNEVWMDFLILHEYGHHLEKQISVFAPIYAFHDGCVAQDLEGHRVNSPEHAWMESFANYFAAAVGLNVPPGTLTGWGSTFPPWLLEPQPWTCAQLGPEVPGDAIEAHVSGALWDLIDLPTDLGTDESFDTLGRRDTEVFQIFDEELEREGRQPTIALFRDAWLARRLPAAELEAVWRGNGLVWDEPFRLDCPNDLTQTAPAGACGMTVDYALPVASQIRPGVGLDCQPPPGSWFPAGTTAVTCRATNESGELARCGFNVTIQAGGTLQATNGTGLFAVYYDNFDFTAPVVRRVDPVVDFAWDTAAPHTNMAPDRYSVRWQGEVVPMVSGAIRFHVLSDDGTRLWVDRKLLINDWTDHTERENSGEIALEATRRYEIKLEYYQHWGPARIKLMWSAGCLPKQTIPASQLFPTEELRIQSIRRHNNDVTVSWNTGVGKRYQVQSKPTLNAAPWENSGAVIAAEGTTAISVIPIDPNAPSAILRVLELP